MVRTFGVLVLFLAVWNGAFWMALGWLLAPVVPGRGATLAAVAILLFLPVLVLVHAFAGHRYPSAATRIWLFRPFWYGQLFLPVLAGAGTVGALVGVLFGAPAQTGRWAVAATGALLLATALWGYLGTRRLVVRPLELRFPTLPPALDGLRIAQLSDLHVGPHTSRRHLARIAAAVRDAEPELIVVTGDQVDDYPRDVEPLARAFGGLAAPLGVVAIAGNHDILAGWPAVRRGMEGMGWRVLVNEGLPLEWGGARFWVVGTGDPAGRMKLLGADGSVAPDIDRTLAGVPRDAFVVALAHNPALWPALAARGVPLTLSGHTHHGQVSVPRLGWGLASPFLEHAMGLYRAGSSVLYINPGTNFWGIPLRIGALPEVTVVTLRRGEE